jgi:hypothetical protein
MYIEEFRSATRVKPTEEEIEGYCQCGCGAPIIKVTLVACSKCNMYQEVDGIDGN